MQREVVQRNLVLHAQALRQLPVAGRFIHPHERGRDRHHSNARKPVRDLAESGGARGQNLGMRRHGLARQYVERRQQQRRGIVLARRIQQVGKGTQQRVKRLGLLVTVGDQKLGTARRRMQQDRVYRLRGKGQTGEAEYLRTGRTRGSPGQRMERGIARQTGKQFLDPRIPQTEGSVAFALRKSSLCAHGTDVVPSLALSARTQQAGLTTLANAGVSVARALVSFLSVGMLVRYLGRESYGLAATVTGMAGWLAVAQGGIGQSMKNDLIRRPDEARETFADAFGTLAALALGIGFVFSAAVPWLPWERILNAPGFDQQALIVASVWIVLGTAVLSLVRAAYGARQQEFRLAPALLAGVLASFAGVVTGVDFGWSATLVVSASVAASGIGLAAGLVQMPRHLGIRLALPGRLYRAGLWFFVIEACTILIFEADLFLVNLLRGQAEAAAYSLHLQLFLYVETGIGLVVAPWWAAFGDAWASGDHVWLRAGIDRLASATALLGGCGVGLLMAVGKPLMNLWSHGNVEWNPLLALLMGASVVVQGVTGVYATALGALGIARDPARIVIAQAILNVCVCIWAIRRFGVTGAALGSLATYTLTSGIYLPWKLRREIR